MSSKQRKGAEQRPDEMVTQKTEKTTERRARTGIYSREDRNAPSQRPAEGREGAWKAASPPVTVIRRAQSGLQVILEGGSAAKGVPGIQDGARPIPLGLVVRPVETTGVTESNE